MDLSEAQLAAFIQQYFLPFVRIGAMFMVMPIVGSRIVSPRVRLALAVLTCVVVVPILPPLPKTELLSFASFGFIVQEALVGLVAGFTFQIIFQMFVLSGQYMAMKMGLGFASMNDPTNGVQTTVLSQFFLMMVTLMFVSVDGHLVLIGLLVKSFQSLPPGSYLLQIDVFWRVVSLGSWMFSAALVLALPVLTSLLFVNMAFGVMSRAAPQLNIFAVGFPFTLMCGLLLIWVGLSNFIDFFHSAIEFGFQALRENLRL
ncbi:flagellar biosynthetic protein FliR [Teredinibacter franksiae]|uniref:flagellar biosynthetic protein FliR n=1 Tax=Teredinibacter franksiae TaxID=2761453 RepID=UPI001627C2EC|nr:flagellar biosynthetic protein FliR [Teredinibacter franksiae]